MGPGGVSNDHDAAASSHRAHAGLERRCSHVVHHHVHATLLGDAGDFTAPVDLVSVQNNISPQFLGQGGFPGAAGHHVHRGARQFCDLNGHTVHTATCSHYQHGFACTEAAPDNKHAPCGQGYQQRCRGGLEIKAIRHGNKITRRNEHVFGVASPQVFSEDAITRTHAVIPTAGEFIFPGIEAGIHHNSTADFPIPDSAAQVLDNA